MLRPLFEWNAGMQLLSITGQRQPDTAELVADAKKGRLFSWLISPTCKVKDKQLTRTS